MSYEAAFDLLKAFMETKPASQLAIGHLKPGHEIRLVIDEHDECALFNKGGQPAVELRSAKNPEVEFRISVEALRLLENHPGDSVALFGIDVCKEVVAGNIKVKMVGSWMRFLRGGYLNIMLEAGPEFSGYLAQHGLKNASKILAAVRGLRG